MTEFCFKFPQTLLRVPVTKSFAELVGLPLREACDLLGNEHEDRDCRAHRLFLHRAGLAGGWVGVQGLGVPDPEHKDGEGASESLAHEHQGD